MSVRKEIVVLSGGGHKGIVKLQWQNDDSDIAQCVCSLDFRPHNATLYFVGDNIAQMPLDDITSTNKVSFCAKSSFGCALRSSSITMFGGTLNNGTMTRKIDEFLRKGDSYKTANDSAKLSEKISNANDEKTTSCKTQNQANSQDNDSNFSMQQAGCCKDDAQDDCDAQKEKGTTPFAFCKGENAHRCQENSFLQFDEWAKYDGNNFYLAVKPQIDEIFVCYPEDSQLNNLVDNSQWVRVQTEDDFYVVGLLYDGKEPAYICYGVPSKSEVYPPCELQNICVWLPISKENGYWVIYQSAKTGEIVKTK